MLGAVALMFVLIQTLGNFLLFCMIVYEKFGMDSKKRTLTNQLLSSICGHQIAYNCIIPTFHNIIVFGVKSKIIFHYPYTNIHN